MDKRRLLLALCLLSCSFQLYSEPVGKILRRDWLLTVKSATDMRLDVTERILVNNENGDELSDFVYFTDAAHSITSFSGKIETGGKVVRKIKQADLATVQYSDAFADDTYINAYSPSSVYPYVVEYTWSVSMKKGIAVFPSFFPVSRSDVAVEEASYIIDAPSGMKVNYKSSSRPEIADDGKNTRYKWSWSGYEGFVTESHSPSFFEYVPYVMACPDEFSYFGKKGCQGNWNEVGKWLCGIFPEEGQLPESLALEAHKAVAGCADDLSKLRALYEWLGSHTRYVSIQLGIGGYSPMSPAQVMKTGYGDCKALSFLLREMLAEVGVHSEYFIVNTERRSLHDGFSTIGQMDHAMLCVPIQKDTVWVECTNTRVPLGFRHSSVAGHEIVLVGDGGGRKMRVPDYPDSLRSSRDDAEITIGPDGSADILIHRRRLLDEAMEYDDFMKRDRKEAHNMLSRALRCHPDNMEILSFKDNFGAYSGTPDYFPEVCLDYRFSTMSYARYSGDRLFIPVSPFNAGLSVQKTARKNDFVTVKGSSDVSSIVLTVPEGYELEFMPASSEYSCEAGWYRLESSVDGNVIRAELSVGMNPCRLQPGDYGVYRDFAKSFNKVWDTMIVLKKIN